MGGRGGEMDKLTIISGCLFLAADIFAIASIANPDWINTGESAGERAAGARGRAGDWLRAKGGEGRPGSGEDGAGGCAAAAASLRRRER